MQQNLGRGITPEESHLVELTRALFGAEGQERDETKAGAAGQGLDGFLLDSYWIPLRGRDSITEHSAVQLHLN